MEIVEKYTDLAGKYRVTLKVNNDRSIALKFQEDPSEEQVFSEAQKIIDREIESNNELLLIEQLKQQIFQLEEEIKNG